MTKIAARFWQQMFHFLYKYPRPDGPIYFSGKGVNHNNDAQVSL